MRTDCTDVQLADSVIDGFTTGHRVLTPPDGSARQGDRMYDVIVVGLGGMDWYLYNTGADGGACDIVLAASAGSVRSDIDAS